MTDPECLQRIAVLEAQYAALRVELREANRKLDRLVRLRWGPGLGGGRRHGRRQIGDERVNHRPYRKPA